MKNNQEFKQTEIGRIPKEWEVVDLSEVFRLSSGEPRPQEISEIQTQMMPYPIYGGNGIMGYTNKFLISKETTIIGRVGEYCGSIHKAPKFSWITDNALYATEIQNQNVNLEFLTFYLTFLNLNRFKKKSGQPLMTQTIIYSIKLLLPPLPEQKKIAEILSTVDKAIEKVSEALEKTERLKKGLMQELLTRGIGHKEFKDTEIGRIPKEWEVVSLGNSAEVIMGQSPSGDTYNEKMEGLPLINGPSEFGERYPIPFKWTTEPTKTSRKGDILICVRGHTTGRLNISNGIYCAGRGIAIIRSKERVSHNLFIYYILESNREKIYGMSYAAGSTFPNITNGQLNKFSIPLPPLAEQKKIAEILSTVDKRLELLRKKKEKLERVKKGLMDDLLSGRKRIKI